MPENPIEKPKVLPEEQEAVDALSEAGRAEAAKKRGRQLVQDVIERQKEMAGQRLGLPERETEIHQRWEQMTQREKREALLGGLESLEPTPQPEQMHRIAQLDATTKLLEAYKILIEEEAGESKTSGFVYGLNKALGMLRADPDEVLTHIDAFLAERGQIQADLLKNPDLSMTQVMEKHRGLFDLIQTLSKPTFFGIETGEGLDLTKYDCTDKDSLNQLQAKIVEVLRNTKMTGGQFEMAREIAEQGLKKQMNEVLIQSFSLERIDGHYVNRDIYEKSKEKIRSQADIETWKEQIIQERPGLMDDQIHAMISQHINQLIYVDYLREQNTAVAEIIDQEGLNENWNAGSKALFEQYLDSLGLEGLSDESWDFVVTEMLINAPLIIVSGGVANLARRGVSYSAQRIAGRELMMAGGRAGKIARGTAGLAFEGMVFDIANEGLRGEWLFNSPDWAQRIMWTSATLGLFKKAGTLGESLAGKEGLVKSAIEKVANPYLQSGMKELVVKGQLEVAAMLLVGAAQNGVYTGSLDQFIDNFGEEVFHAYVAIGSLKTAGKVAHETAGKTKSIVERIRQKESGEIAQKQFDQHLLDALKDPQFDYKSILANMDIVRRMATPEGFKRAVREMEIQLQERLPNDFDLSVRFFADFTTKEMREIFPNYESVARVAEATIQKYAEMMRWELAGMDAQALAAIPRSGEILQRIEPLILKDVETNYANFAKYFLNNFSHFEGLSNYEQVYNAALRSTGQSERIRLQEDTVVMDRRPEKNRERNKLEKVERIPLKERPAYRDFESILRKNNPEKADQYLERIAEIDRLPSMEAKQNALLEMLREHHEQTRDHSVEIAELMDMARFEFNEVDMLALSRAMKLHDIGKIAVSERVLDLPRKPDSNEKAMIEQHPNAGAKLLEALQFDHRIIEAAQFHHLKEVRREDGSISIEGYPAEAYREIYGERALSTEMKLTKLFDVYEAITSKRSKRPYQEQMTDQQAFEIMERIGLNEGAYEALYARLKKFILEKAETEALTREVVESFTKRLEEGGEHGLEKDPVINEIFRQKEKEVREIRDYYRNQPDVFVEQVRQQKGRIAELRESLSEAELQLASEAARQLPLEEVRIYEAIYDGSRQLSGLPGIEGMTDAYIVKNVVGVGSFGQVREIFYRDKNGSFRSALMKSLPSRAQMEYNLNLRAQQGAEIRPEDVRAGLERAQEVLSAEAFRNNLLNHIGEHSHLMRVIPGRVKDALGQNHLLIERAGDKSANEYVKENPHQAEEIIFQVMEGAEFMWTKDLVHRDIQWSNVMVESAAGHARLIDMGQMAAKFNTEKPETLQLLELNLMEVHTRGIQVNPHELANAKGAEKVLYDEMQRDGVFREAVDQLAILKMVSEIPQRFNVEPEAGSRLRQMIDIAKRGRNAETVEALQQAYRDLQSLR